MPTRLARFIGYASLIVIAAGSRFLPHMPNMTALGAVALLGGAYYFRSIWVFLVPILSLFVSDLILNNTIYAAYSEGFTWWSSGSIWIYVGLLAMIPLAALIFKNGKSPLKIIGAGVGGGVVFYLVSNFGVWISMTPAYPMNATGLLACYIAGLPFLLNTILGNLLFSAILFPAYDWYSKRFLSHSYASNNIG